jgi:SpoIID/LytB domain protein
MKKHRILCLFIPALLSVCAFSCKGVIPAAAQPPVPDPEKALAAYYAGKVEEAAAELEAAAGLDGGNTAVKRQLAAIYRELGDHKQMLPLLEELAAAENSPGEAHLELFTAYYLAGNYKKAADCRNAAEEAARALSPRKQAEFLFIDAMLKTEEGDTAAAIAQFQESLELERYRPIAWFTLGGLLEKISPREAETCYRNAITQDAALTGALYPLGRLLAGREAWPQAEEMLERAARRRPEDREIAAALAEARRHAGASAAETAVLSRKIAANPPKVTPFRGEAAASIRIGLAERRELVTVKPGGAFRISGPAGLLYRGGAREQFWVAWTGRNGGNLSIRDETGAVLIATGKNLTLELVNPSDTVLIAGIVSGFPRTARSYRGALEFMSMEEGMTVVNFLNVEEYLYSVVPSEMPSSWPAEALKAQAVAARSYSIAQLGQFAERGFDLFGTPHSMAYHGTGEETKAASQAVDATRGMILTAGGETLKAYFSANHGGYSEDSLAMWGFDAHMAAVPDVLLAKRETFLPLNELESWLRGEPYSYSSVKRYHFASSYRWEKWVAADEIRRRLRENQDEDPGEIRRVVSRGRGVSGRVKELEVAGSEKSVFVKGDAIWSAMGALRSSLFTVDYRLDEHGRVEYVVFHGAGHGHGIGLDQHGAAGMASAGYTAEQILKQYYPRAELTRL